MVAFVADGRPACVSAGDGGMVLAHYLRDVLGLTTVSVGCEEGSCGACTALVNGAPVPTCLVHVARLDGATVETAAAVADTELGAAIAQSIVAGAGLQCGFCTPGILCSAYGLLAAATGQVDGEAVEAALAGHLCRCTGYRGFVAAIAGVAEGATADA